MTLPTLTFPTSENPSPTSPLSIAFPWTSSTPGLSLTITCTLISLLSTLVQRYNQHASNASLTKIFPLENALPKVSPSPYPFLSDPESSRPAPKPPWSVAEPCDRHPLSSPPHL